MHLLDRGNIDTTPGSNPRNPFCPPVGFNGDIEGYKKLVREKYENDFELRIWMRTVAIYSVRYPKGVRFLGPFAQQARNIVESLKPKTETQEVA